MSSPAPLVVVASGSSAAIVLPSYLEEIREVADDVTVVLTASATRFVSAEVAGWFAGRVVEPDAPGVNPVEVALKARSVVVLPASANTVATAALGLMPTTAATVIGASPQPCLFFPQMHEVVWRKPLTQRHLAALEEAGHTVVGHRVSRGYEISRGATVEGWSMPAPADAAAIVADWLGRRAGR